MYSSWTLLIQPHGNPLQYSCLENLMDRGSWWAIIHGVEELDTTWWLTHHHQANAKDFRITHCFEWSISVSTALNGLPSFPPSLWTIKNWHRASQIVQWLGICLPMQGMGSILVWKVPHAMEQLSRGPQLLSLCSGAQELQLRKPSHPTARAP